MSFLIGFIIMFVYRKSFRGVLYNHNFSVSLLAICIITSVVIMTISSNIVLSLGMVGALSIVRFRTAIKDPLDIVFLFWAIASGIATGAKLYMMAISGCIFIAVVLLIFLKVRRLKRAFLLVVKYDDKVNDRVKFILSKIKNSIKSKTVINGVTELTVELRIKGDNTAFVNQLSLLEGVHSAVLVDYNGENYI